MRDYLNAPTVRRSLHRSTGILLLLTAVACSDHQTDGENLGNDVASLSTRGRSLAVSLRDSSINVGDTVTVLTPELRVSKFDGTARVAAKFRSSDTTVVSVSSKGVLLGRRAGRASITVRTTTAVGVIDVIVGAPAAAPAAVPTANPGALPAFMAAQLPQATVSAGAAFTATRTIRIAPGDAAALQTALNAAQAGDEIILADGATYVGSFHLPKRTGSGTVLLRSATVPAAPQNRITPTSGNSIATLLTRDTYPALVADDGAQGWRVVGVRLQLADGAVDNYGVVTIGSGVQTSAAQFPRDIILDRVIVSGSASGNTSRCVALNGVALAVVNSWLTECHARGRDAQAIGAWTGAGPLLVENNYLEGSGQGILLGGADPRIAGMIPADITIRRNYLFKPLAWAGRWTVKAAFEIKNAERVLVESNVIENHWADAQVGFAILLQAVNQEGHAPWSTISDVTIRSNIIRNSRSGVNILSRLTTAAAPVTTAAHRIHLRENSFENVGRDPVSGAAGRFVQLLDDLADVSIVQNTFFGTGAANAVMFDGLPQQRLVLAHNVFGAASYGILGSGFGEGSATLAHFAPSATVTGNVFTGATAALYPVGNAFPNSLTLTDFSNPGTGNYTLQSRLAFNMLNGTQVGVNGTALLAATNGVTVR